MAEAFRVLCADVPWPFKDNLAGRGAGAKYRLMSMVDICNFPLPKLEPNAVLFLWRVAAMQQEALDVIHEWGFPPPQREVVWLKKTSTGGRWFGLGHVLRAEHEVCLLSIRGRVPVKDRSVRSTFVTDDVDFEGLSATTGRHSEKPEAFYDVVERLFDGPYCELFARRRRSGWTCLGDQLPPEEEG